MLEIENLRTELDQIHSEIFKLLIKRFELTKRIWQIKIQNKIALLDLNRESRLAHQFDNQLKTETEKLAVQKIMKTLVEESKKIAESDYADL